MTISLPNINTTYEGFNELAKLAGETCDCAGDVIDIDLSKNNWIDGNMCAAIGAIVYKLRGNQNKVNMINIDEKVHKSLSRNNFLSSYGAAKLPDTYGTTIAYTRFEIADERYFPGYLAGQLAGKGIPQMSNGLEKRFKESLCEIFNNSVIHSETQYGIFTCGQHFPTAEVLDFSIADLGIGIRENVLTKKGLELSAKDAILWAVQDKNTTRTGNIPGGSGLKLLREFVALNQGKLQIASDLGFWQFDRGTETARLFDRPFPGTIVNIEINTADDQSYSLANEVNINDIL